MLCSAQAPATDGSDCSSLFAFASPTDDISHGAPLPGPAAGGAKKCRKRFPDRAVTSERDAAVGLPLGCFGSFSRVRLRADAVSRVVRRPAFASGVDGRSRSRGAPASPSDAECDRHWSSSSASSTGVDPGVDRPEAFDSAGSPSEEGPSLREVTQLAGTSLSEGADELHAQLLHALSAATLLRRGCERRASPSRGGRGSTSASSSESWSSSPPSATCDDLSSRVRPLTRTLYLSCSGDGSRSTSRVGWASSVGRCSLSPRIVRR